MMESYSQQTGGNGAPGTVRAVNFRERTKEAMTASMQEKTSGQGLAAGIDIGSTTTKIAVLDPEKGEIYTLTTSATTPTRSRASYG